MKQDLQPQELQRRLQAGEKLRIVDVRSPSDFASGHVPGAENQPLDLIGAHLAGVLPTEPVVLVCQGGVRSNTACAKVMASHDNLFNLVGGTNAWIAAGLAVEATEAP